METSEQMDRKEYMDERRLLVGLETDSSKSFDSALLTFSSGAIVLSVTFLEKFEPSEVSCLLILSWFSWFLSIVFQLLSYLISTKAMREELRVLNKQYSEGINGDAKDTENAYSGWPTILGNIAFITFIIGTAIFLFLVSFDFN